MRHLTPDDVLIDGQRIAHGVHGPADGAPVVLLHGTPSFSMIWRAVVPELTAAGRRVHLCDLLGYGHSERPRDPTVDTSVAGQVGVLARLFETWGLADAHVVAHDIGGAVAMRFTLAHPDSVRSLTLIDTVSFDSWPSPRTRRQMQAGLDRLISAPDAEHRAHFRQWLQSAVHDPANLSGETLEAYLEMIAGPVGQASLFQHQVAHYDSRYTEEISQRLRELSQGRPVQLIWGAADAWQDPAYAERLHAGIPGSQLHWLDACGHFAPEEKPAEIAALVRTFTGQA
jgi:pimeloyl-ACP methyl ester carboxylesterase